MKSKIIALMCVFVFIVVGTLYILNLQPNQDKVDKEDLLSSKHNTNDNKENVEVVTIAKDSDYLILPSCVSKFLIRPVQAKGIYLTGYTAGSKRFDKLLELAKNTEINAMVIDVKDDCGDMTYESSVPNVSYGNGFKIKDIDKLLRILDENDIYPIARIVTFKDPVAADECPEIALKRSNGSVWHDRKGIGWLNPYNSKAWEHPVAIAEEAIKKGFAEVQFDYVRFPTDGKVSEIDYGDAPTEMTKAEAINAFLSYANDKLGSLGGYVSADVFGLTTSTVDDMGIGQQWEQITAGVDYICPMVYPSHYIKGNYGLANPNAQPYKLIKAAMTDAIEKNEKVAKNGEKPAIIRPWLQSFTLGSPKYGPEHVRAQINATYDVGLSEWILWNAGNYYMEDSLLKADI